MPLTQRDAFLPRASPPDPTLRSGLPECGIRALSRSQGPGKPKDGGIHACCSMGQLYHLARGPHWGPLESVSSRAVLVPSFLSGKGSKTEDAPHRGWWTSGRTGLDALIRRGSLPLLKEKEFAKNRFKVNTSIEMVDGGHRNASMAARKIKILKQPTRNS